MLCKIRFSGTDYAVYLSFREFVDMVIAPDFFGPPTKVTDGSVIHFRPLLVPEYMDDEKVAWIAYERVIVSMNRVRSKIVSAYRLDEDETAMLLPWNVEKVVPID